MTRRPLNFYDEIAIEKGTRPPLKSKKPLARETLAPALIGSSFRKIAINQRPGYTTRARNPSSNDANYQTTAKRRRITIEHSSNSDVDYNDNNDYGSPIRFPRRVSPVRPSTSFMSLNPDPNDDIDVPEYGQNHSNVSSPVISYQASQNTSSNLSISSDGASNSGDSIDIHDHVHYSMDSEPSPTQLKQHINDMKKQHDAEKESLEKKLEVERKAHKEEKKALLSKIAELEQRIALPL